IRRPTMRFPRTAAWSCRCEGLQTCLSYSLAQDRWLLVWCCVNEMSYRRLFERIATDSFFQLTICLCCAFVLAQMFSPTNSLETFPDSDSNPRYRERSIDC